MRRTLPVAGLVLAAAALIVVFAGRARRTARIAGTVRSILGRPVAGAMVSVRALRGSGTVGERSDSASTDTDGAYHLALAPALLASDPVIEASHPQFATGWKRLLFDPEAGDGAPSAPGAARGKSVDFKLVPLASISGQVIDFPTGRGVSGATVSASGELDLRPPDASPPAGPRRGPLTTVSGAGGAFALKGLLPGTIRLTASRADLATRVATIVPLLAGDELAGVEVWVDVVALPLPSPSTPTSTSTSPVRPVQPVRDGSVPLEACSGIVTGTVTDAQGHPARSVWVGSRPDFGAVSPGLLEPSAVTPGAMLTDDDGRFVLEGLCPGSYRLSAHSLTRSGSATKEAVHAGDQVLLTLGRPATLLGSVRYAGSAVASFVCILTGPMTRRERIEDGDGSFRLPWLDPGHYELVVEASEGRSVTSVDLLPNDVRKMTVVLSPGGDSGL